MSKHLHSFSFTVVLAVLLFAASLAAQSPSPQTIRGIVVDAETNVPLAAFVRLTQGRRQQVTTSHGTDASGTFALSVTDFPVVIIARSEGYGAERVEADSVTGYVTVRLRREGHVKGQVIGTQGVVDEGTVRLKPLSVNKSPFGIEGAIRNGRVWLRGLSSGTIYQVTVVTPACGQRPAGTISVGAGERREAHIFRIDC